MDDRVINGNEVYSLDCCIYILNINTDISNTDLQNTFSYFGKVKRVRTKLIKKNNKKYKILLKLIS
jgi:RNA recognition motif-containing protein